MGLRNISAWSIRNPVIPIVLFTFLLAMGLIAFMRMDVNLNPDVSIPAASVSTSSRAPPRPLESRSPAASRPPCAASAVSPRSSRDPRRQQQHLHLVRVGTPIDRAVTDVRDAVSDRSDLPDGN